MKLYNLDKIPYQSISHNAELKKKVLVGKDELPCIQHISHIILKPGNTASRHSHHDSFEVFYCIRGEAIFNVNEKEVSFKKAQCLIVEPGELHAISNVNEETELLYFRAAFR